MGWQAFVADEVRAEVSFAVASQRLAALAGSALVGVSHLAWRDGLARVGPAGSLPGLSKLVHVQFRDLVQRNGTATLTLRWQATGALGGLLPALDADVTVIPDGDDATLIGLEGVYGPPGGFIGAGIDRALLHRIATATVRSFLSGIAQAIADLNCADPAPGAVGARPTVPEGSQPTVS
ncbi:MAG TPA: hypothetical protein VK836_16815 [Streptosporangiaceae bacterium]|nr:hypothetical protein [Streptosporangiaceae bacterium]